MPKKIETCKLCGCPVVMSRSREGTCSYEIANQSNVNRHLNVMLNTFARIKETCSSWVLLSNQKIDLILSDIQKAEVDVSADKIKNKKRRLKKRVS